MILQKKKRYFRLLLSYCAFIVFSLCHPYTLSLTPFLTLSHTLSPSLPHSLTLPPHSLSYSHAHCISHSTYLSTSLFHSLPPSLQTYRQDLLDLEKALKHRHLRDIEERVEEIRDSCMEEILQIKCEANSVVEKTILDTELHIQEVKY